MSNLFKYISGRELMERWSLDAIKMRQLCGGDIQAYTVRQKPLHPVPPSPWGTQTVDGLVEINANTQLVPYNPESNSDFMQSAFLISDIKALEKKYKELQPQKKQTSNGIVIDGTAPEQLRIAAEAWEALYKSGEHLKWKKGHIKSIVTWIRSHYPHIAQTPAEKIAQIINQNPKGGSPSQ